MRPQPYLLRGSHRDECKDHVWPTLTRSASGSVRSRMHFQVPRMVRRACQSLAHGPTVCDRSFLAARPSVEVGVTAERAPLTKTIGAKNSCNDNPGRRGCGVMSGR